MKKEKPSLRFVLIDILQKYLIFDELKIFTKKRIPKSK
jgi:hypothetical protein